MELKTMLSGKSPISSNAFFYCKIAKENSRGDEVVITSKVEIPHKLSLPLNITLTRKTRISSEITERNVYIILCYFALEWQFVDVVVAAEEDKMSNTSFADSTDDLHMRTAGIAVDVLDMGTVVVLHFEQSRETFFHLATDLTCLDMPDAKDRKIPQVPSKCNIDHHNEGKANDKLTYKGDPASINYSSDLQCPTIAKLKCNYILQHLFSIVENVVGATTSLGLALEN
ncbi:hypothetical protein GQX74_009731 [Glossina fuscipes]|nr:hypothetical protein GQX74_009731 [Glossina fuscipes]